MNPIQKICTTVMACLAIVAFSFNATAAVHKIEAGSDSAANGLALYQIIENAQRGDLIYLGAGIYSYRNTTTASGAFKLKSGIGLYGGFIGDSAFWDPMTMLNRDSTLSVITSNGDGSVFYAPETFSDTMIIDAVTITGGKTEASSTSQYTVGRGGGIIAAVLSSSNFDGIAVPLQVNNCIVTQNTASWRHIGGWTNTWGASCGGGVYRGTYTNCYIHDNLAITCHYSTSSSISGYVCFYSYGGGCYDADCTNCIIENNTAISTVDKETSNSTFYSYGGGCYKGTYRGCKIYNNSASATSTSSHSSEDKYWTFGGGGSDCNFFNCHISNNKASATLLQQTQNTQSYGGGCNNSSCENCIISNNTAFAKTYTNGGCYGGTINNCLLVNNYGALWGSVSNIGTFKNCVIWGNNWTQYSGNIENSSVQGETASTNITTLSAINMDKNGPQFLAPSMGAGADYDGTSADWRMWETTAVLDSQAPDAVRVSCPTLTIVNVTATDSGKLIPGTVITAMAILSADSIFTGWLDIGLNLAEDSKMLPTLMFNMPDTDVILTATYRYVVKY